MLFSSVCCLYSIYIYKRFIRWHSIRQWNQFLDTFPSFSNAVGMIDGTIHRFRRPYGPLQAEFYCGDKCCHFISSQIVVDADGLIVLPFTGYSINHLLWANFFFWHGQPPLLFLTGFQDTWMMPDATGVFLRLDMGEPEICPVEHALGILSMGRFRGNGNFSDWKSLGRKQRRSRENINVKQQMKFAAARRR